jgi:D-alanyl-D-alanine carboxypeptidase
MIPSTCPAPYAGLSYNSYMLAIAPNHQFSPDEFVGVNATCQTSYFAPGTSYKYSNTGYSILATIIERVSGIPYDQFVLQNLIIPNGLSSTSVQMLATQRAIPPPFNPGYIYDKGVMTDATEENVSQAIGEGNIVSPPADIARWVKRLFKGEAGPNAASVETMKRMTPQSGNIYGLGIFYVNGLGYGHNGVRPGYMSLMMYDPGADVTTILYFNVLDFANTGDQLALEIKAARDARAAVGY